MLAELVVVFCMSSDPSSCEERRYYGEMTNPRDYMSCATAAEVSSQPFLDDHPKYEINIWRCNAYKKFDKNA